MNGNWLIWIPGETSPDLGKKEERVKWQKIRAMYFSYTLWMTRATSGFMMASSINASYGTPTVYGLFVPSLIFRNTRMESVWLLISHNVRRLKVRQPDIAFISPSVIVKGNAKILSYWLRRISSSLIALSPGASFIRLDRE